MTEEDSILENELRALRPRAATPGLLSKIERDLAAPAAPFPPTNFKPARRFSLPAPWINWAAAAIVVATLGLMLVRQLAVPPLITSAEIETQGQFLISTEDEGLVELADGRVARQFRQHYLDTHMLENTETQLTYAIQTPRDEIRLVVLNLY